MAQHTPGPYYAVGGHFVASKLTDEGNIPAGFLLADLRGCPNCVANSALFAAAPALLAAAKEAEAIFSDYQKAGHDLCWDEDDDKWLAKFRAAIAAAEPGATP